jgi:photosystem II stability/assembly factor-like uncharacterized protein
MGHRKQKLRWALLLAATVSPALGVPASTQIGPRAQPRGPEIGEPPDIALRRLRALHDMYAAPEDQAEYDRRRRVPESGGPAPRPLPVNFGNDANLRLRALQQRGTVLRGSIRRLPTETTSATDPSAATNLGPTNVAGRVSAVAVHASNPAVIYRGTAGGGVWKSTDSGTTWTSLTDNLGNLSIGAVAIAPSNPSTIYVGTGEGVLSVDGIDGIGLIKSTDGGTTWILPKAVSARKFFALSVHPTNPDEILAATSAGIQKSTDGGVTWTTALGSHAGTELARVPGTPSTILATVWDILSANSTGGGFVHRSTDGGNTWTKVGGPGGAPFHDDTGRLALAIAPSAPDTIYVLSAAASGDARNCANDPVDQRGFYRSTDGGTTWTFRSNPISGTCPNFTSILAGQGWYASTLAVDPSNAAVVYAGGLDLWKSTDGAATWERKSRWNLDPPNPRYVHADIHELVWAGKRLLVGNDGGIETSLDQAATFSSLNTGVVTRQYYSVAMTPASVPLVIAGAQDNGTDIRIGSTNTYREVIGGDGFAVAAHPTNAAILYGTIYSSRVFRSTDGGASFDEITPDFEADDNRPFITPLTMDPNNPATLYTGSNFLWKTANGGNTWARTSNTDLGNGGPRGYITKIAVARSDSKRLLTSSGSGQINKSTDGGATWTRIAGLPTRYASHVEFDPANALTFYVAFINTGTDGRLFRTTNEGASFTRIDAGLPPFPIHVIRVDPLESTTLYAGTDVGLYRSTDAGATWAQFGAALPAVSVWDIAIRSNGSLMRVATHGRGLFEVKLRSGSRGTRPSTR